jgi:predicted RNA-binding protein with TRAM domain
MTYRRLSFYGSFFLTHIYIIPVIHKLQKNIIFDIYQAGYGSGGDISEDSDDGLLMSYTQSTRGYSSYSGRTASNSFSRPVEIGKEYTVDITDIGRTGVGIARIQRFVIFVKKAKRGDKNIKSMVNSVGDRFATAEVIASANQKPSTLKRKLRRYYNYNLKG